MTKAKCVKLYSADIKIYGSLSTEKKIMVLENRLVVSKGEGEGVEWTGNLGLIDVSYCLFNK